MWIRINAVNGPKLAIPVPLSLLRSRLIWQMIEKRAVKQVQKAAEYEDQAGKPAENSVMQYYPMAREVCMELSRYIRRNGHFTMVEVHRESGDQIRIEV